MITDSMVFFFTPSLITYSNVCDLCGLSHLSWFQGLQYIPPCFWPWVIHHDVKSKMHYAKLPSYKKVRWGRLAGPSHNKKSKKNTKISVELDFKNAWKRYNIFTILMHSLSSGKTIRLDLILPNLLKLFGHCQN